MSNKNRIKTSICFLLLVGVFCGLASCTGGGSPSNSPLVPPAPSPPAPSVSATPNPPVFDSPEDYAYAAQRVGMAVQIVGDGSIPPYTFSGLKPYFDDKGMTMLPMTHFKKLFLGNVDHAVEDGTVTVTKNVLGVVTTVSVTVGSNVLLRDGVELQMNTAPVLKDGTVFIPLEYVGHALSCGVYWDERLKEVSFYQYTALHVYLWNENQDSSSDGLRYACLVSGDGTTDMSVLSQNATADFAEVENLLKQLPKDTVVCTTLLYRIHGYAVPYTAFEKVVSKIFNMGLQSSSKEHCLDEIPPIIKDFGEHTNAWYSQELYALEEATLYDAAGEVYRFCYFPAFLNQVVVRVEMEDDGTAAVYYKVSKGQAYGGGGGISKSAKAALNAEETNVFLNLLEQTGFWEIPKEVDDLGLDGHYTVVEGIKDGVYHIIDRWMPKQPDPTADLEHYFLDLIKQLF